MFIYKHCLEDSLQNYSYKCRNKLCTVVDIPMYYFGFSDEAGKYTLSALSQFIYEIKLTSTTSRSQRGTRYFSHLPEICSKKTLLPSFLYMAIEFAVHLN